VPKQQWARAVHRHFTADQFPDNHLRETDRNHYAGNRHVSHPMSNNS